MKKFVLAAALSVFASAGSAERSAQAASIREFERSSQLRPESDEASASKGQGDIRVGDATSVTSCRRRASAHQRYLIRRAVRRAIRRRTRGH